MHTAAPAAVIPFPRQPYPLEVALAHFPPEDPTYSVILREWPEGQARHCTLCPRGKCYFTARGSCAVVAPGLVGEAAAPLYRLPG